MNQVGVILRVSKKSMFRDEYGGLDSEMCHNSDVGTCAARTMLSRFPYK